MNFLAHAYLSFYHPQVLVGNMISDFVKGAAWKQYPASIRFGIQLHRRIDTFTDNHEMTKVAKQVFRPHYRLYSGALMDIVYDHFLASDNSVFPGRELELFALHVYTTLEQYTAHLPSRFLVMLPYMKTENWLYNYSTREGINKSLRGLVRRSAYLSDSDTAYRLFEEHYSFLKNCYKHFFGDVKNYAKNEMKELNMA